MTLGAVAVSQSEKRLGWGRRAVYDRGAGAYAATQSGTGHLEDVITWSAMCSRRCCAFATPLIFGALGGIVSSALAS